MSDTHLPIPPALGLPVPSDDHHAISVQLPQWRDMVDLGHHDARISKVQRGGYPRSFLHRDVVRLSEFCRKTLARPPDTCLLFPAREYAVACIEFVMSRGRSNELVDTGGCLVEQFGFYTSDKAKKSDICLFAAFLPSSLYEQGLIFWRLTGLGISSRLAEACLGLQPKQLSLPNECTELHQRNHDKPQFFDSDTDHTLRHRLADLHNRASLQPASSKVVGKDDVFLYPTGMAAIYHTHQLLLRSRGTKTAVFGFPYELTLKMVQTYGSSCEFWGYGTDEELDQFEKSLELNDPGNQIQAVWCECASNPLLRTVDLVRIHRLARQYGFVVVIDDTIGTVANVDLLGVGDMIITSLTKSFSGYANVMAGSTTLNPRSQHYHAFQDDLRTSYQNYLFRGHAEQLEMNSRDYLQRSSRMNETASRLVKSLCPFVDRPGSPFVSLYYPEICWSTSNYPRLMRPATEEYTPGFGSLFTIEFVDVDIAAVFFDNLIVPKGPSLGAQYTLAQPYVQTVFQKEKEWASRYGLKESIVRISVGLEDQGSLIAALHTAAEVADQTYRRRHDKAKPMISMI